MDHPAVALSTTAVAMSPLLVLTPRTRPPATSMPVTSVFWWMCTPRAEAPRAYPQTTASWRMMPPGGCQSAPMIGYRAAGLTSRKGASRLISAGPITSESTPSTLFTSARQRIVRSDASLWASVRWPRWENITL